MKNSKQSGLSLIELLVAVTIGGFLIIGAVTMQSQTRKTFTVNEQQARLQETARYVLSVIEPEVQMGGLFGFSNDVGTARFKSGATTIPVRSLRRVGTAQTGVPAVLDSCGANYVLDVGASIFADNGSWSMACAAGGGGFKTTTDTLIVRRSSVEKATPTAGRIQYYSSRLSPSENIMFANGVAPGPIVDKLSEVRDLIMQAYYVSRDSDGRPGMPALRLKQISAAAGAGVWDDQEVIRGVEDIQIELGVDPGKDLNGDGAIDVALQGMAASVNGDTARYVSPGAGVVDTGQVVAVRIWVRVRAEELESGFIDRRTYKYADTDFTPADGYRRVVMSRTIFLRNSVSLPADL